jgi:hypothetical protein
VIKSRAALPLTVIAAIWLAGCSSSTHATDKRGEPAISIHTLEISAAQPRRASTIPIIVRVGVTNTSQAALTVDRIDVSSVGVGPYDIASTARDFHHVVEPGHVATFPIWVQATVSVAEQTISGQESSMMIRAVVFVSSPVGPSRSMTVQRVDTTVSRRD